ncbi:hypothetical protein ABZ027_15600 [Streptomyces sp. NPDC006332]|uniref:hypothetical protein n=1 Tax=Streptomyces sp. NPDC006332 TaxID=3155456 RepID=UPI0033AC70B3
MAQSAPPPPADGNPYAQQPGTAPQPQPTDGNPFAQQPTDGNPFAQQPGAVPPPPAPFAPARSGNVALGLIVAVVAALVTAGIYGAIIGATEREIGYAAVGVGFLIGLAAGKLGGSNPVLPVVSALLSLGAVYVGQLIGVAMIMADVAKVSLSTMITEHFDLVTSGWKETADAMTFVFFAIGAFAAFSGAKKAAL